jgi:hypothetical protein
VECRRWRGGRASCDIDDANAVGAGKIRARRIGSERDLVWVIAVDRDGLANDAQRRDVDHRCQAVSMVSDEYETPIGRHGGLTQCMTDRNRFELFGVPRTNRATEPEILLKDRFWTRRRESRALVPGWSTSV